MLLFPLEPALTHEKITVEFVKCHNVLCEGPSRNNAHVITLSGVRGNSEQVCFFFFPIYEMLEFIFIFHQGDKSFSLHHSSFIEKSCYKSSDD